ncbi:hypothetical protein [Poseidonocella sp. HB161398]|uniref:hypothetical protein n=1 Tax=Poseidonocella sp. HB161398 TaxID=2320855 RepID=UPI001F0F4E48|nr:hypothetical protein [Poseidonocella sp. HB161398]
MAKAEAGMQIDSMKELRGVAAGPAPFLHPEKPDMAPLHRLALPLAQPQEPRRQHRQGQREGQECAAQIGKAEPPGIGAPR